MRAFTKTWHYKTVTTKGIPLTHFSYANASWDSKTYNKLVI